jgi:hypothetical protein
METPMNSAMPFRRTHFNKGNSEPDYPYNQTTPGWRYPQVAAAVMYE